MSKSDEEPEMKKFRSSSVESPRVMERMRVVEGTMKIIQQKFKTFETNILINVNTAISSQIEQAVINALKKAACPVSSDVAPYAPVLMDEQQPDTSNNSYQQTVQSTSQPPQDHNLHQVTHQNDQSTSDAQNVEWMQTKSQGKKPNFIPQRENIDNSNKYGSLSSLVEEDGDASSHNFEDANITFIKPKSIIQKKSISNNKKVVTQTKAKTTPIVAYNLNQKALKNGLHNMNKSDYKILRGSNPDRVVILPSSKETREATLSILTKEEIPHFTYKPIEERNTILIIKHIPNEYEIDDVKEELASLGFSDIVVKISQPRNPSLLRKNFFLIHIRPGANTSAITKNKWMFNTKVVIEKFLNKDDPQCYSCQRTGHFAEGCRMGVRCVKCSEKHNSIECPLPKDAKRDQLKCALCGLMGHPASYRGCTKRKEILKNRNKNLNKPQATDFSPKNTNKTFNSRLVDNNVSYSSLLKPSVANNRNLSLNNINSLLNSASEELFGCNYKELKSGFDEFLTAYNNIEDPQVRKQALLNFIMKTNYNG